MRQPRGDEAMHQHLRQPERRGDGDEQKPRHQEGGDVLQIVAMDAARAVDIVVALQLRGIRIRVDEALLQIIGVGEPRPGRHHPVDRHPALQHDLQDHDRGGGHIGREDGILQNEQAHAIPSGPGRGRGRARGRLRAPRSRGKRVLPRLSRRATPTNTPPPGPERQRPSVTPRAEGDGGAPAPRQAVRVPRTTFLALGRAPRLRRGARGNAAAAALPGVAETLIPPRASATRLPPACHPLATRLPYACQRRLTPLSRPVRSTKNGPGIAPGRIRFRVASGVQFGTLPVIPST